VRPGYLSDLAIDRFINTSLMEDLGEGDHSSLGAVPNDVSVKAKLIVKEDCVLAGLELAEKIFSRVDPTLQIQFFKKDGKKANSGDIAFIVEGKALSILSTERIVLNCMQRMSGISTLASRLTALIKNTKARLMDTRKTTPNFRLMEKWAVHIGGGLNHRFGLYDMVMLKDNHIDSAGGIGKAVKSVREYLNRHSKKLNIEVETRTLEEVKEALAYNVDVIMLDNMSLDKMKEAVQIVNGQCKLEASGGITEATILSVAETGVDFISMGALTHSVKSIDLSLKVIKEE
jgi:nicotinate-nucleotide pyrophosphorylase (carboxylating)